MRLNSNRKHIANIISNILYIKRWNIILVILEWVSYQTYKVSITVMCKCILDLPNAVIEKYLFSYLPDKDLYRLVINSWLFSDRLEISELAALVIKKRAKISECSSYYIIFQYVWIKRFLWNEIPKIKLDFFRNKYFSYGRLLHPQITHHCFFICNDTNIQKSHHQS